MPAKPRYKNHFARADPPRQTPGRNQIACIFGSIKIVLKWIGRIIVELSLWW